jgi:N-acetylmuramoyl-L-alanine amidase
MKMPVILVDNGHGRETAGKRSVNGKLREYSWTREIAGRVVADLRDMGVSAFRLTPEDVDVPLATRVKRVEAYCRQYGKKNVILISVHVNASGNGEQWLPAKGWSAYTTPGVTESDEVARCLYARAETIFKGRKIRVYANRKNPDFEANLYILKNTSCPAVLTENFFMDNVDDVNYILSDEGKDAVVRCHVEGIVDYIRETYE